MKSLILIALTCLSLMPIAYGQSAATQETEQSAVKVDLNTATERRIAQLPGVGEVNAHKIISARPFSSLADLAAAGVPQTVVNQIAPLVTLGAALSPKEGESIFVTVPSSNIRTQAFDHNQAQPPRDNVDLNHASILQLEELPGVDAKKAQEIVAHRPYAAPSDITKAGFSPYEAQSLLPYLYVTRKASTLSLEPGKK